MVDVKNGTTGKRRGSKPTREVDDKDSDAALSSNANTTSTDGGGGIDTLLQQLDDIDLGKKHKRPSASFHATGGGATTERKTSDVDEKRDATPQRPLPRRLVFYLAAIFFLVFFYDALASPPDERLLKSVRTSAAIHDLMHSFLLWVREHPGTGAAAFIFVYALCVELLLPGTPLTWGGGYGYNVA